MRKLLILLGCAILWCAPANATTNLIFEQTVDYSAAFYAFAPTTGLEGPSIGLPYSLPVGPYVLVVSSTQPVDAIGVEGTDIIQFVEYLDASPPVPFEIDEQDGNPISAQSVHGLTDQFTVWNDAFTQFYPDGNPAYTQYQWSQPPGFYVVVQNPDFETTGSFTVRLFAGVPEASAWAMMIAGMLLAGLTLRFRAALPRNFLQG